MLSLSVVLALSFAAPVERKPADWQAVQGWEGAGVYAFDGYPYVLDLTKMAEKYLPGQTMFVTDCSDEQYYCLRSGSREHGVAWFVIPRRCVPLQVGQRWEKAGVVTEVLAEVTRRRRGHHPVGTQTHYLLGDPNRPGMVFEYWRTGGIRGIYWGRGRYDMVERARKQGDLSEFELTNRRSGLMTLDDLAPCSG